MANSEFVKWLRDSAPYINTHRGRTFVLALGGDAIASAHLEHITHDIALMTSLGIRLVLVHGARQQIEDALNLAGEAARYQQYFRVTSAKSMAVVKQAVGAVRFGVEASLATGVSGTPMHRSRVRVISGNFVVARPMGVLDGVDLGYTGAVRRIDVAGIRFQLDAGNTVLNSPIGYSPTGEVFNLNADDLAATVAIELGADKLIVLDDRAGVLDGDGNLVSELSPSDLSRIVAAHIPEQTPRGVRLNAVARAAQSGVARCHVVSYLEDGDLLTELFTHIGAGTAVSEHSAERMRGASTDDVAGIIDLIRPLEEKGYLVRRSRELLEREIDRFVVAELDGWIIGCAALYPYAESGSGELACLATHPDYRSRPAHATANGLPESGEQVTLGENLLNAIVTRARQQGLTRLFALTTQTSDWFREHGFHAAELSDLPASKLALYNMQRNSKVLIKEL